MFNKKIVSSCLIASKLSYGKSNFSMNSLKHLHTIKVKSDECHIFYSNINKKTIFAITGTQNLKDFLIDAKIKIVDFDGFYKGKVHRGFQKSFKRLYEPVNKYIEDNDIPPEEMVFCGHSLGGAVATLLYMCIASDGCYTFGSPRVVNEELANSSKRLREPKKYNFYRFYARRDPISVLPSSRKCFRKNKRYFHVGFSIRLGGYGFKRIRYHKVDEYIKLVGKL